MTESSQWKPSFDLKQIADNSLFTIEGQDAAAILTHRVSLIAIGIVAAFLSGISLIGENIECWCPAQFTDSMCNYTKSLCWVSENYVIDENGPIPFTDEEREETQLRELTFYPMVPFILLGVALLLSLPQFIWSAWQSYGGVDITRAVHLAAADESKSECIAFNMSFNRPHQPRRCGRFFNLFLKQVSAAGLFFLGLDYGTYQTGLFLLSRLCTMVVLVITFVLLGVVLHEDFFTWGWKITQAIWISGDVPEMYVFPRATLCDFKIRQMNNVHDYTVQCVLPINMWSEKIFIALWYWLVLLVIANLYSFQYWVRKLLLNSTRKAFVGKHLSAISPGWKNNKYQKQVVMDFAFRHLVHDHILLLRILELAEGFTFTNDVIRHLWEKYRKDRAATESIMGNGDFELEE